MLSKFESAITVTALNALLKELGDPAMLKFKKIITDEDVEKNEQVKPDPAINKFFNEALYKNKASPYYKEFNSIKQTRFRS